MKPALIDYEIDLSKLITLVFDKRCDPHTANIRSADNAPGSSTTITVTVPVQVKHRGVESKIVLQGSTAQRSLTDPMLIGLIAKAHLYLEALSDGSGAGHTEVANRLGIHAPDISRILPMAFLSPKITEAILMGQQPADLTIAKLTRMLDVPMSWLKQHKLLGA